MCFPDGITTYALCWQIQSSRGRLFELSISHPRDLVNNICYQSIHGLHQLTSLTQMQQYTKITYSNYHQENKTFTITLVLYRVDIIIVTDIDIRLRTQSEKTNICNNDLQ